MREPGHCSQAEFLIEPQLILVRCAPKLCTLGEDRLACLSYEETLEQPASGWDFSLFHRFSG